MSRRGWKSQRAELFGHAAEASEPERVSAPETPAPSGVWDDEAPAPLARERRRRKAWFAGREEPLPKDLVGRDLAGPPRRARARRRLRLPILIGAIAAALLLVTLRVEILRLRYAAAEVAAEEETLLERIRQATVRVRELRDPARLNRLASERGFVRPERVLSVELAAAPPPPVAAAPADAKEPR